MPSPAGGLSLSVHYASKVIAASATFQTLVGEPTEDGALAHVYRWRLPDPASGGAYTLAELQSYRPYALVAPSPEGAYRRSRDAEASFDSGGAIAVRIIRDLPSSGTDAEKDVAWDDIVSKIIDEIVSPSIVNAAGYLAVETVSIDYGPYRNDEDDIADEGIIQGVDLTLTW